MAGAAWGLAGDSAAGAAGREGDMAGEAAEDTSLTDNLLSGTLH